jgi:hypothetical protein
MEVGQGPNWGCSAKGKKKLLVSFFLVLTKHSALLTLIVMRKLSQIVTLPTRIQIFPVTSAILMEVYMGFPSFQANTRTVPQIRP